jgi:hypothetical protein
MLGSLVPSCGAMTRWCSQVGRGPTRPLDDDTQYDQHDQMTPMMAPPVHAAARVGPV